MGPTAAGKTDLAILLASELDCELVSVDSALVYRGLDVGSAKPEYPHHLVDVRDPAEPWSVADFCDAAREVIDGIVERGRTPLLVGGTMLYFKALLEGIARMPPADPQIRQQLEADAARDGWAEIHRRLAQVDPESARRIHPNHSQRLGRALEVWLASGVTLSEWHARGQAKPEYRLGDHFRVLQMAISPADRAVLHQRITRRTREMMKAGLESEVRGLYQRGDLGADLPAVRAVGYRQLWGYLEGEYDLNRAEELIVIATRQLAKRQLTWLRNWPDLHWIYTNSANLAGPDPEKLAENPRSALEVALKYLASTTM
jgi:tRNA dimethylallyltransferase